MATPIERTLRAAEREFQAEQRYDKAEEAYRRAHRDLCVLMAGLEATQGKASEFTQFCEQYADAATAGTVKPRVLANLRRMRKSGLLDVPEPVVAAVDPEKIIVAAAKVNAKGSALTEEVAVRALAASEDESSDVFAAALDIYAEQMAVLDRDEQVLPGPVRTPKPLRLVQPGEEAAEAEYDAEAAIRREAITEGFGAIVRSLDEAAQDEHPAVRHLERAESALRKMPARPDQKDALVLRHMEIGAFLDAEAAVTDAAIQQFIDGDQDPDS